MMYVRRSRAKEEDESTLAADIGLALDARIGHDRGLSVRLGMVSSNSMMIW